MSGHYQGLGGAAVLVTEALLDARELIGGVSDAQAMGAIYGPAGTGKSFAVTEVLTDRTDRDWAHTDFRCRPTLRYVRQELARLLGIPEAGRLGPFEADWSLKHALWGVSAAGHRRGSVAEPGMLRIPPPPPRRSRHPLRVAIRGRRRLL